MARMDLITEPRQVMVRTLDAAICGSARDTNSFWGLAPSTTTRSRYTFLTVDSAATIGTRWKPNLRGTYEMAFFCFLLNESEETQASARVGLALDPSVAKQSADPSNATDGIFALDADVLPAVVGGIGGALNPTDSVQIDDVRVGDAARGWLHVLLSNGAGATPTAVVAAGATLWITRTGDVMGSWV
jgi:hypothetical protein